MSAPSEALSAVGKEDIARAASLFDTVKGLRLRLTDADEAQLDRSFQQHTTSVLEKLNHRLQVLGDQNPTLRKVELIMAKHGLFDAAFQQVVVMNSHVSPILGDSLKELRAVHLGFLSDFQGCVGDYNNSMTTLRHQAATAKSATNVLKDECTQLLESVRLLDSEADAHQAEIVGLRRKVRLLEETNDELSSELKGLKAKGVAAAATRPPMDTSMPTYNKFLVPRGAGSSPSTKGGGGLSPTRVPESRAMAGGKGLLSSSSSFSSSSSSSKQAMPPPPPPPPASTPSWFYNFRVELQAVMDSGKCRLLNLSECKDLLEKLYLEKTMAERRTKVCETMEAHVYRSMEKKYGLRSLAVEHAGNLLRSLDHHADNDNEVAVFLKVFRNEIEEDYRFVAQELRKSIKELLFDQVLAKYPTKDRAFLQRQLDKTLAGTVTEEEWNEVIKYLYNGADSAALNVVLKRQARDERVALAAKPATSAVEDYLQKGGLEVGLKASAHSTSPPRTCKPASTFTRSDPKTHPALLELTTALFVETVLDFQLRAHEKFLINFHQNFAVVDQDHDSVISRGELMSCFKSLRKAERTRGNGFSSSSASNSRRGKVKFATGPAKVRIIQPPPATTDDDIQQDAVIFAKLLAIVDPQNTNKITFSQAVSGLSKLAENAAVA